MTKSGNLDNETRQNDYISFSTLTKMELVTASSLSHPPWGRGQMLYPLPHAPLPQGQWGGNTASRSYVAADVQKSLAPAAAHLA